MPDRSHAAHPESLPNELDARFMERALNLAQDAVGLASPNPTVGCVLTSSGPEPVVLGEGAHLFAHRDHAEVAALRQAAALGHDVRGATAYVTLEPCSHHGRTGPCALALIAAGIARVVVATTDPNPLVSGSGLTLLRQADIAITLGPGQQAARTLNLPFAFSIQHRRPFVTLKAAISADGFVAPAPATRSAAAPVWITSSAARAEVHRLRHASDALLTGIGTILADDPALTDRSGLPRRRPLLRVLLDPNLRTPPAAQLLSTSLPDLVILYTEDPGAPSLQMARRLTLQAACPTAEILPIPTSSTSRPSLSAVLAFLAERQCLSVLLESGPSLNAAFLAQDLVDRVILHQAPHALGPGSVPFTVSGPTPFQLQQRLLHQVARSLGPDIETAGLLHDPWPSHL